MEAPTIGPRPAMAMAAWPWSKAWPIWPGRQDDSVDEFFKRPDAGGWGTILSVGHDFRLWKILFIDVRIFWIFWGGAINHHIQNDIQLYQPLLSQLLVVKLPLVFMYPNILVHILFVKNPESYIRTVHEFDHIKVTNAKDISDGIFIYIYINIS